MVQLKSLAARMGSYGGLQCRMRGYTDTQGAAPWSLSGTRGSWVVFDLVPCMRVYIYAEIHALRVLFNALYSLGGVMGSLGSLQCHMRGCTGSPSMVSEW